MNIKTLQWAETQSQLYQVLTNPRRLLILRALAEREMSVGELATLAGTSLQNTSQHLRLMKDRDILTCRREGQTIYYRVADLALLNRLGLVLSDQNP
jgi:ArsR family transcriptional regulator, virulence genes transcriptional regulator